MKASVLSCLVLGVWCLAGPLVAGPALSVPATVKGEPAEFIKVPADTPGKSVKWVALDRGLAVFPTDLLRDQKTAVVAARSPGSYRLLAITCQGEELSEPAICLVVIEGQEPAPGPAPAPPAPVPPPEDPLLKALQAAYSQEPDPAKAASLKALAALFRQAAGEGFLLAPQTWKAVYLAMAEAARVLGAIGKLPLVQRAIQAELVGRLPARDGPLNDQARKLAASTFARIAQALEAVR